VLSAKRSGRGEKLPVSGTLMIASAPEYTYMLLHAQPAIFQAFKVGCLPTRKSWNSQKTYPFDVYFFRTDDFHMMMIMSTAKGQCVVCAADWTTDLVLHSNSDGSITSTQCSIALKKKKMMMFVWP
jgi:hypothetical protein